MKALVPFLIIGVVAILAALLARPDSDRVDDRTPVRVLRYGWRFRAFVLVFTGYIPVLAVVLYVNGNFADVGELVAMGLLNLLALYSFLEVFVVSIQFDENGLTARSPWRKTRRIQWSEIVEHDFEGWSRYHLLRTQSKGTVRLSVYLTGVTTFLEELERRAPQVRWSSSS